MDLTFRHGHVERADDGSDALRVVMANEGRMGDGLDLRMSGVDLARFEANPVLGFGHNYFGRDSLPIGRVENVAVVKRQLVGDVIFDQDDVFAVDVERKIRDGFLSAFSIGFDVRASDDDGVVTDWELFELSVVPIPMDPGALVSAGRAANQILRSDLLALADRLSDDLTERDNTGRSADAADGGVGGDDSNAMTPQARGRVLKLARTTTP